MTKNKIIFKKLCILLCIVPILIFTVLNIFPHKNKLVVHAADEVVENFTFFGSNIISPVVIYKASSSSSTFFRYAFVNFSFSFSLDSDGYYDCFVSAFGHPPTISTTDSRGYGLGDLVFGNLIDGRISGARMDFVDSPNYHIKIYCIRNGNITRSVNRVRLSSERDSSNSCFYNTITYYDTLDNSLTFKIDVGDYTNSSGTFSSDFSFIDRTYFINLSSLSNNTFYENGYSNGYNDGLNVGNDQGYQDGYRVGNSIGYQNGYSAGLSHGDNYSFSSLLGAVIDVPVNAFTSLLNFEILGVNILGFITGLLTLALIIFIIKLCMGGK